MIDKRRLVIDQWQSQNSASGHLELVHSSALTNFYKFNCVWLIVADKRSSRLHPLRCSIVIYSRSLITSIHKFNFRCDYLMASRWAITSAHLRRPQSTWFVSSRTEQVQQTNVRWERWIRLSTFIREPKTWGSRGIPLGVLTEYYSGLDPDTLIFWETLKHS